MSDLCLAGCGFYGNPATMNMCSKCFRESQGGQSRPAPPSGEGKKSTLKSELKTPEGVAIQVRHGDMTTEEVDAIVNAANSSLDHASGLAGAIVKKGGTIIQQESDVYVNKNGKVEEGGVVRTSAGKLPCKHVFHAVAYMQKGPMWHGGVEGEEIILGMTVRSCLEKADELKLTSISLPAISSGIFGFPKEKCASVMFEMARSYVKEKGSNTGIKEIRFTNFDDKTVDLFHAECLKLGGNKS